MAASGDGTGAGVREEAGAVDTPQVASAPSGAGGSSGAGRSPVAWKPVAAVAVVTTAVLLGFAGRYGYHRDELYFRLLGEHPRWGYVDQPPLTPLIARASIEIFGDHLWAIRVVPALIAGVLAVLLALVAREAGGGRPAQVLASLGVLGTFPLIGGHTLSTATPDLVVWLLVILLALRALLRDQPRYWLAAGAVTGLGLYDKHLVILLLLGLGAGLVLVGPRRPLRSWQLWAGVAIAVAIGSPNLVYQVVNHFPQLEMARAVSRDKGPEQRILLVPMQLVMIGLPLVPVWVAGIVTLLRRRELRPARALVPAYLTVCLLVLVTGGQFYYPLGLLLALYAVGSVAAVRAAGRITPTLWTLVAVHTVLTVPVALPLVPLDALGDTAIPATNQVVRDEVGWPDYVRQIAGVYRSLPDADRANAVIIVGNYGEAGAIDRYGPAQGLPRAYSGHNELYHLGRPPRSATVAVVVFEGDDAAGWLAHRFRGCADRGRLDNGLGVENEEQHAVIRICRDPVRPWPALWPDFQHFD